MRIERTQSRLNPRNIYIVESAQDTVHGNVVLRLSGGCALDVFLAGSDAEAWRIFPPAGGHLVFPTEK